MFIAFFLCCWLFLLQKRNKNLGCTKTFFLSCSFCFAPLDGCCMFCGTLLLLLLLLFLLLWFRSCCCRSQINIYQILICLGFFLSGSFFFIFFAVGLSSTRSDMYSQPVFMLSDVPDKRKHLNWTWGRHCKADLFCSMHLNKTYLWFLQFRWKQDGRRFFLVFL